MKIKFYLLSMLALILSITANALTFEVDGIEYSTTTGGVNVTGFNSTYEGDLVLNGSVTYDGTEYNVIRVNSDAFKNSIQLTSIGDLSACTSIGSHAFLNCTNLTSIGDLSSCTSIESYAFQNCTNLTSIGDLSACQSFGSGVFLYCYSLETIVFSNETPPTLRESFPRYITVFVPESLVETYRTSWSNMANHILAVGVKTDYNITVQAQDNTSSIYSQIGEELLGNVMSLKMTGTINGYDIMVLRNKMYNLHHLDLSDANIVANDYEYYTGYQSQDNVMGAYSFYNSLANLMTVKLPKTITSIGNFAFSQCDALRTVEMYEGVTTIGGSAFYGCDALKSVKFPSTLKTIGNNTFAYCSRLTTLILPENLKTIGGSAFNGCSALTEVRIPSLVESIGASAFAYCSNLKDVWTYTLVPQVINENTYSTGTYSAATLHVQKTSYYPYYWNTEWSQFSTLTEFDGTYSQWLINNQTDYVIDDNTGVIDTSDDATGEIEPGSGLISDNEDEEQNMDDIIIDDDGTTGGSVIGHGHLHCNKMHFCIAVVKGKWYFLCFPFRIMLSDITCPGSYVFRYYDGSIRASHGNGGWQNLPSGTESLDPWRGYIFQCNKSGILDIKVRKENINLNPSDLYNAMTTYLSDNAQNASWNFMGNPHTSYFDMDHTGYECPITIWNGSSYEAMRPGDDDYHFRPFQAFFVQKPTGVENMVFPEEYRETYNMSKKASQNKLERRRLAGVKTSRLLVNLVLSDGTNEDKTRVVFNENSSTNYEMSCDAAKFMTTNVPQLYSLYTDVSYAINERPVGSVNIGYQAPEPGDYKISALRMDQPVLLHDNVMNITFDLANGDYIFSTNAGTFNNRFMLMPNNEATGIADMKIKTGVSVMAENGGISFSGIDNADVNIFSVGGAAQASHVGNGFVSLPAGTYLVKVNNLTTKVLVR